jgi:hypothetical protein
MHVTHMLPTYLQLVGFPTFQAQHFQVFSVMIVVVILVVDSMFFRPLHTELDTFFPFRVSVSQHQSTDLHMVSPKRSLSKADYESDVL